MATLTKRAFENTAHQGNSILKGILTFIGRHEESELGLHHSVTGILKSIPVAFDQGKL